MLKQLIAIALLTALSSVCSADKALFAGGCFWCIESDFQDLEGIRSAVSGYTGGNTTNPNYKDVTYGNSGHYEAVEIEFDPAIVSYSQLLQHFWRNIDPLDASGQFCDKGASYRSAIFPLDNEQQALAQQSMADARVLLPGNKALVTKIIAATAFYPAEDYHQDYYIKNPKRYKYYRWNCGRDKRLKALWGAQ
ncbi:MAG: peptide-methionine (S)-S-oxide reductase [Paraglaciecola psychrophila]|jgi:peptide-methionine (S)-S-oxide reductase